MAKKTGGYGFEIPERKPYDGRSDNGARQGDARYVNSRASDYRTVARTDGRGQGAASQRPVNRPVDGAYRERPVREIPGQRNARVISNERPSPTGRAGEMGLTDRQMRLYERAYYEKYGRSPYIGGERTGAGRSPSAGASGYPGHSSRQGGQSYANPSGRYGTPGHSESAYRGASYRDQNVGAEKGPMMGRGGRVPGTGGYGRPSGNGSTAANAGGSYGAPYQGGQAGGAYFEAGRADRRQAFLYEEEMKRREAERARAAAEAEARRRAEAEERRLKKLREKANAERIRQAEIRERDREGLLRYEEEKRRIAKMEHAKVIARRRAAAERLEKKKRRRHMWRVFKFHLKVFFITLIVMGVLVGVYTYRNYFKDTSDASRSVKYSYFGGDAVRVGKDAAYRDGSLCVNFTEIANGLGLYTVGNSSELKYVFPDTESASGVRYIKFMPGSPVAEVNGTPLTLSSSAYYNGSVLWVSADIMDCFTQGISYTKSAGKVEIDKIIVRDEDGKAVRDENGDIVYEDIVLLYGSTDTLSNDGFFGLFGDVGHVSKGKGSDVKFISNLLEYEEYMNPEDSTEFLVLVNKTNTVNEKYVPSDLTDLVDTRSDRAPRQMRLYAAKALEAMFIEMRAAGYTDVSVTSGYRSYAEQVSLFNTYITNEMAERGCSEAEAREIVLTYSAAPGTSEHQTGLCVDMHNLPSASTAFANEEVYDWLTDNAWKFGFILRFPEDKTAVTGYSFEPWHYRYVGRYVAEKIHENGQCLEEYLAG